MKKLYPVIDNPINYKLKVGDIHQIYVEECGNHAGIPIIFLHGGPGSGCQAYHRQFFDPDKYRIILFDQRGCGRSTPKGCLQENTTQDLIADMETIRTTLNIEKWILFGGSWGVTLALLYAETFPDFVSGIILRGSFLGTDRDLDWFFGDGVARIFPDEWQLFTADLDKEEVANKKMIEAYHRLITSNHKDDRFKAARAWSRWTGRIVTWTLPQENASSTENEKPSEKELNKLVKEVHLEIHYAINNYFLKPDQLVKNIDQLPETPIKIIHGRRDITCPLESSWRLNRAIPHSELVILPDSGHLANEPAMIDALITSTDQIPVKI